MAKPEKQPRKGKWYDKLKSKYRLVIMNDQSLEERITFRLTRLNVFIALGFLSVLLIFLTIILIAFTPLREYIPGYTDVGLRKSLYELQLKTDSIETVLNQKDLFIDNLRKIINGEDFSDERDMNYDTVTRYADVTLTHSEEDSLLRSDVEALNRFNLYQGKSPEKGMNRTLTLGNMVFYAPVKGVVTNEFNLNQQHFGVDIVSKRNEAVKAVLDGTVVFSTWTVETGYVIEIQHHQGLISMYKHNSALMKRVGDIVKGGEVIAIIGESGEYATGPHLHFELWYQGTPVDPADYITF